MKTWNDEDVIALLKDAVPTPPDVADRVGAIRHRAGAQRRQLATRTVGLLASLIVVVGGAVVYVERDGRPAQRVDVVATGASLFAATTRALDRARGYRLDEFSGTVDPGPLGTSEIRQSLEVDVRAHAVRKMLTNWQDGKPMEGPSSEFVWIGGSVYARGINFPRNVEPPPGRPWVRFPASRSFDELRRDTASSLDLLRMLGDDLRATGTEEVRGVQTTRYTTATPRGGGEVTLWVDEAGVVRRLRSEIDMRGELPPGTERPREVFGFEIYDLDRDVRVSTPPASEVVDHAEIGLGPDDFPGPR